MTLVNIVSGSLTVIFIQGALGGLGTAEAQVSFRVRSDFSAGLNEDRGWSGGLNENVSVQSDRPFRIRFELESARAGPLRLQARRNGGDWQNLEAHDFPHPETKKSKNAKNSKKSKKPKTPRASVVSCAAYKKGAPTTDLLRGSTAPFRPGAGIGLADRSPPWIGGGHGEFEWALVIRRFADGAMTNEQGDIFEFRIVRQDGSPLDEASIPALKLEIPRGHVGGTFVETPGRIGPYRASNGDLYFIMEPAETSNLFMMIKSSDQGRTWREVDGANRPSNRDLESVDARRVGDTIHIVHQVTRKVYYHSFRTSDHPTHPDTWDVRGELADRVDSVAQAATLAVRSDGSLVAFYVGQTKIHGSVRSPSGSWREIAVIDAAVGPQCIVGSRDIVHLAYTTSDGSVEYRRMSRDGALSQPLRLATGLRTSRKEFGSVLPLVFNAKTGTLVVLYRHNDGHLWERRVTENAPPTPAVQVTDRTVIHHAVDSQQPAADVVLDGDTLRVLFVDKKSRSIYATHGAGGWRPSALQVDGILGTWVRGNSYLRSDGAKVYGYIFDAGSDGGAGMNRFAELLLSYP